MADAQRADHPELTESLLYKDALLGPPALFLTRYAAHCIDVVVFSLLCALVLFCFGFLNGFFAWGVGVSGALFLATTAVLWAANWFYNFMWNWNGGQTLGKRWVGLMVVGEDQPLLTARQANLRWVGYHLTALTFGIGFLASLLRPGARALHDVLSGTKVVHVDPRRKKLELAAVLVFWMLPVLIPLVLLRGVITTYNFYYTVQPDVVEIRTRNGLGALRESIRAYRMHTGVFPDEISEKAFAGEDGYVVDFPAVNLPHKGHNKGKEVVRGPRILADSGRWVYDSQRGDIHIDCTHVDMAGTTIYSW